MPYFRPKNDTSGRTREALSLIAEGAAFKAAGAIMICAPKDPVNRRVRFVKERDLQITRVSDAEDALCERCGTWVEKSMCRRRSMGIDRAIFSMDTDGVRRCD